MSNVKREEPLARAPGWREQKRELTKARIAEAGMRMFTEVGFEAATLEAIAAEAGIAPRTFFHYFPSKEALLFAYEDKAEDSFRSSLAEAPSETSPFEAVRIAMLGMVSAFASEEARALDRLLQSTEALRARKQANYEREEQRMVQALREKWPDPKLRLRLAVAAMLGMGAMRVASEAWSARNGSRSLHTHLEEAFTEISHAAVTSLEAKLLQEALVRGLPPVH